jgi:hypothetical protein
MRPKIILPWRYLVLLAIGLIVLLLLIQRYGRSAPVLFGWLAGWLIVSRGVEWVVRRRQRPLRFDREED